MRVELDAKIRTRDGHDAGTVRRVLIDPASRRITGFVVSTGGLLGREVIVGEDDFAPDRQGDTLVLRIDKHQLEQQPIFEEHAFIAPPSGLSATLGYGFPPNAYLMPIGPADDPFEDEPPAIKKGDTVKDRDGDVIGSIDEVRFDEKTGTLSAIVVRAAEGLERLLGGGKHAQISAEHILRVVEGEVRVGIDREEILASERETGAR